MPPDTLIIKGDTVHLLQEAKRLVDSLAAVHHNRNSPLQDVPQYIMPEWVMLLVVFAVIALLFVIVKPFRSYTDKYLRDSLSGRAWKLLASKDIQYSEWLSRYNPYFRSLSPELKNIFLFRVAAFMLSKRFRFHSLEEEEYIKVLVSGAAVQITFGLRNFLLDFFPVIHIVRKEYFVGQSHEIYHGHVSRSGIHIAWDKFMAGYEDYNDADNVGLHEMAHALSFDVFWGATDHHDYRFKQRMQGFMEAGRPVFMAMRKNSGQVLDDYASTNFEEFWAVCTETFFENPSEFKEKLPYLYAEICRLLNQDPLAHDKIINKKKAGIA